MTEIIKVELFRLKKSVLFWVMFAITAALPLLSAVVVASLIGAIDGIAGAVGGESGVGMSAWEMIRQQGLTVSYISGWAQISSDVAVLSVITTAVVLSSEFSDGTMRNVILANKTRAQLYFGYLITSIIVALTFLIANFAITMIIIAPIFGFSELSAGGAVTACLCSLALGIIAVLFMETCMSMFLFATRKTWAAILFPLLICIGIPSILQTIVVLVISTMALKGQPVSADSMRWIPFIGISLYNPASIDGVVVGMNILYMAVFIAMFVTIGLFTFKKADLK